MSKQITQEQRPPERFAEYLEKLYREEDRAALAALRRGLGKRAGEAMEMHRYVLPNLRGVSAQQEDAYYIVAALFGFYPSLNWQHTDEKQSTNLGASLRKLADENENDSSIERRFVALLNCRNEELPEHLRQIVSLLKTRDVLVDWARLIRDINFWNDEERQVQRNWSRAFWRDATGTGDS